MMVSRPKFLSRVTVEPVLFLYMLGIFLLYGVIQALIYRRVCLESFGDGACGDSLYHQDNQDKLDSVQADASKWIKISTVFFVVPSIFMDCYMGSWSDRFGRKLTLVLPPTGAFLSTVVYAVMVAYPSSNVRWILLASFLQGVFGAFTSVLTGVLAYIGAVTNQEERTARFSVLLSMSFVAGTVGPILSTFLASKVSHLLVFCLIGVCHLCAIFYIVLFVKDTPKADSSGDGGGHSLSALFSLRHLQDSWRTCFAPSSRKRGRLVLLLVMAFLVMTMSAGELDIAYLYLTDKPREVGLSTFGLWFGLRYGLSSLALLLVLPALKGAWCGGEGISDGWACAIGLASKAAALVLLGLSTKKFMIFIEVVLGSLNSFGLTAIRAMMSQCVQEDEQGKLFGLFAVFEDVSVLLGALIFNTVYPVTRPIFSGLPFVASAAVLLLVVAPMLLAVARGGGHTTGKGKVAPERNPGEEKTEEEK